jgi:hypothetical protein
MNRLFPAALALSLAWAAPAAAQAGGPPADPTAHRVSDHWGIGLDLQGAFSSNRDKDPGTATFRSGALGLAFSATYN